MRERVEEAAGEEIVDPREAIAATGGGKSTIRADHHPARDLRLMEDLLAPVAREPPNVDGRVACDRDQHTRVARQREAEDRSSVLERSERPAGRRPEARCPVAARRHQSAPVRAESRVRHASSVPELSQQLAVVRAKDACVAVVGRGHEAGSVRTVGRRIDRPAAGAKDLPHA